MTNLPFTFAYCNQGDPWNAVTMDRFDESIFSFKINEEEGQFPTLDLTIRNPRIGLLNPSRQLWAYLGYRHPTDGLIPLFHGVLVGIPTDMFKELITLQFISRAPTYISDKQAVAETMKIAPYYDPIWLDDSQRDQPDSILEGWSALWHIDRLSLATTATDVLVGEDGVVTFLESDAFYDNVGMQLDQPPLVNIRVEANVKWTQRSAGYITDIPPLNIASYTGGTFFSDWPKPGSSIGGGYRVNTSYAVDTYHVDQTPNMSFRSEYHSGENPGQCGTESASVSSSGPALLTPKYLSVVLTEYYRSGVCFPDSDPPQNIPAEVSITGAIIPVWYVTGNMSLRYDAEREYGEYLSFDMIGNVQGILASPTVDQNTELLTLNSVDLGIPLPQVTEWTVLANKPVEIAQIIWPNNPTKPGGLAYQICVQAGVAGATEPVFSDLPGVTTSDGSVIWASLGDGGLSSSNVWSGGEGVPTGMIILMTHQDFNPAIGELEDTLPIQTSYYICLRGGITDGSFTRKTYVPPIYNSDEATPEPITIDLPTPPAFTQVTGAIINDGSVVWMSLGPNPSMLAIPIGGTPDNVTANNFFPSDRGKRSIEYLICRARARLRYRSRAVSVNWTSPFEKCVYLSCRKNATINDPRIPGGAATGKIVAYSLECDGDKGELRGNVKIGCSVGFGNSVAAITGTPEYASAGYAQAGWQRFDGATTVAGSNDVTYTSPYYVPFDDGLQFPLTWTQVSDGGIVSGTMADQEQKIKDSFTALRVLTYLQNWSGQTISTGGTGDTSTISGVSSEEAWVIEREELALASQSTQYVMEANPVSWTFLLKPCSGNGPFIGSYEITVSQLEVPQGINLAAPSNP